MPIGINTEILAATSAAATTTEFTVGDGESVTVFCTPNLSGGEVASVQVSPDGGSTWVDYQDVEPVELSWLANGINLLGPAKYRLQKGVTSAPVAIRLQQ